MPIRHISFSLVYVKNFDRRPSLNPIGVQGGGAEAPPVAEEARRKPSEQGAMQTAVRHATIAN
ncbi:MAG: hypothetical protein ACOYI4_09580 [Christensenellales bacterium]